MTKRVLLLCNGEPPSRALTRRLAAEADLVVAADGGANTARRYGIRPDLIIGDLDSVTRATRRHFRNTLLLRVSRQDNTDLEKALDYLVAKEEATEAIIVGGTGGRIDFTLANMAVAWNYTRHLDWSFRGDGWCAMPVVKKRVVSARIGTTVSLIPFGECAGITLKGLRYPLVNAAMTPREVGVSNVVCSSPFSVTVRRGNILLIVW